MKIINTSYNINFQFTSPEDWLKRINFFTGILEQLSIRHDVHSIEQINYKGDIVKNNVQYHFPGLGRKGLIFPWRLHRYIKKLKPDMVFINGLIFPLQVVQLRLTLGKRAKIILIHHAEKPFNGIGKYFQRFASHFINAYFFTSVEFGNEWMNNGNLRRKSKVYEVMEASSIFSQKDKQAARKRLSLNEEPVFLWVGRLNANKNPLMVVKAFIGFLQYRPQANLYMIFQTNELLNDIKDLLAKNNQAQKSIHLIGKIAHDDMEDWYNSANFFISGSYYEGSGVSVCEAMSCGCIPILTDIISFRKMTGRGKCGFLYEAGNEADLLLTLKKAAQCNIEHERQKAVEQFREELSFEAIGKKLMKLLFPYNQKDA